MLFQIWLFRVNQMDGSNSNVTELVEQLLDPSEKLLGYKVTKEQSNELEEMWNPLMDSLVKTVWSQIWKSLINACWSDKERKMEKYASCLCPFIFSSIQFIFCSHKKISTLSLSLSIYIYISELYIYSFFRWIFNSLDFFFFC